MLYPSVSYDKNKYNNTCKTSANSPSFSGNDTFSKSVQDNNQDKKCSFFKSILRMLGLSTSEKCVPAESTLTKENSDKSLEQIKKEQTVEKLYKYLHDEYNVDVVDIIEDDFDIDITGNIKFIYNENGEEFFYKMEQPWGDEYSMLDSLARCLDGIYNDLDGYLSFSDCSHCKLTEDTKPENHLERLILDAQKGTKREQICHESIKTLKEKYNIDIDKDSLDDFVACRGLLKIMYNGQSYYASMKDCEDKAEVVYTLLRFLKGYDAFAIDDSPMNIEKSDENEESLEPIDIDKPQNDFEQLYADIKKGKC